MRKLYKQEKDKHANGESNDRSKQRLFRDILQISDRDFEDAPGFKMDVEQAAIIANSVMKTWSKTPSDQKTRHTKFAAASNFDPCSKNNLVFEVLQSAQRLYYSEIPHDVRDLWAQLHSQLIPALLPLTRYKDSTIWTRFQIKDIRFIGDVFAECVEAMPNQSQVIMDTFILLAVEMISSWFLTGLDDLTIKQFLWQLGFSIAKANWHSPTNQSTTRTAPDLIEIFTKVRNRVSFTGDFARTMTVLEAVWQCITELTIIHYVQTQQHGKLVLALSRECVAQTIGLGTWAVIIDLCLRSHSTILALELCTMLFTMNVHCSREMRASDHWLTAQNNKDWKETLTLSITRIICTRGLLITGRLSCDIVVPAVTRYINMYTELIAITHNTPTVLHEDRVLLLVDKKDALPSSRDSIICSDYCGVDCIDIQSRIMIRLLLFYLAAILSSEVQERDQYIVPVKAAFTMMQHTTGWKQRGKETMKLLLTIYALLGVNKMVEWAWDDIILKDYLDEEFCYYMIDICTLSPSNTILKSSLNDWLARDENSCPETIEEWKEGCITKLSLLKREPLCYDELLRFTAIPMLLRFFVTQSYVDKFIGTSKLINAIHPFVKGSRINDDTSLDDDNSRVQLDALSPTLRHRVLLPGAPQHVNDWAETSNILMVLLDNDKVNQWRGNTDQLTKLLSRMKDRTSVVPLLEGMFGVTVENLYQTATRSVIEKVLSDEHKSTKTNVRGTDNAMNLFYDALIDLYVVLSDNEHLERHAPMLLKTLNECVVFLCTTQKRMRAIINAVSNIIKWYWTSAKYRKKKETFGNTLPPMEFKQRYDCHEDICAMFNGLIVCAAVSANYQGMLYLLDISGRSALSTKPGARRTCPPVPSDAEPITISQETVYEIVKHFRRENHQKSKEERLNVEHRKPRKQGDSKTIPVWNWMFSHDFKIDGTLLQGMVDSAVLMDEPVTTFEKILAKFRANAPTISCRSASGLIKLYGRTHRIQDVLNIWDLLSATYNYNNQLPAVRSVVTGEFINNPSAMYTVVDGFDFKGVSLNANVYAAMFDAVIFHEYIPVALSCFEQMKIHSNHDRKNIAIKTVHYSILIKGLFRANLLQQAIDLHLDMVRRSISFSSVTFNNLIHKLVTNRQMEKALSLLMEVKSGSNFTPDVVTYSTLIRGFCESSQMTDAIQVFRMMTSEGTAGDIVCFNTLLDGAARHALHDVVKDIIDRVTRDNSDVHPTPVTLTILTRWFDKHGDFNHIVKYYNDWPAKYNFTVDLQLFTAVISSCLNHHATSEAVKIYADVPEHIRLKLSSRFYGTLIRGLLNGNRGQDAVVIAKDSMCQNAEIHYSGHLKVRLIRFIQSERNRLHRISSQTHSTTSMHIDVLNAHIKQLESCERLLSERG